jgi:hypothetical protein
MWIYGLRRKKGKIGLNSHICTYSAPPVQWMTCFGLTWEICYSESLFIHWVETISHWWMEKCGISFSIMHPIELPVYEKFTLHKLCLEFVNHSCLNGCSWHVSCAGSLAVWSGTFCSKPFHRFVNCSLNCRDASVGTVFCICTMKWT